MKKVVIDLNEDEVDISKSEIDQPSSAQTVEFEDEFTSPSSKDNGLNTLSFYYQESTPKKEESKLPEIKSVFNKPVSGNKPLTEGKNLADAENTPAYERRNVRLDRINSSAETTISRTRIFMDEENKLEIREENSFLHDNVD